MEIIRSVKDEHIKQMTQLADYTGRKAQNAVPLYGMEAVEWAHAAGWHIEYILISESAAKTLHGNTFLSQFKRYYISDQLNKKITGVSHIIGVCGCAVRTDTGRADFFQSQQPVVVMDRVMQHGNIGTIVRTMRGFGFAKLIMTDYGMDIFYKNIVSASRGESFNIDFANMGCDELTHNLKLHNYKIIATKADCDYDINDLHGALDPTELYAIVFGNEERGISEPLLNRADVSVGCRLQNGINSLNVGVAAGIILNGLRSMRGET